MKYLFYISDEEEGAAEGKCIYTMHIYVNLIAIIFINIITALFEYSVH